MSRRPGSARRAASLSSASPASQISWSGTARRGMNWRLISASLSGLSFIVGTLGRHPRRKPGSIDTGLWNMDPGFRRGDKGETEYLVSPARYYSTAHEKWRIGGFSG